MILVQFLFVVRNMLEMLFQQMQTNGFQDFCLSSCLYPYISISACSLFTSATPVTGWVGRRSRHGLTIFDPSESLAFPLALSLCLDLSNPSVSFSLSASLTIYVCLFPNIPVRGRVGWRGRHGLTVFKPLNVEPAARLRVGASPTV